jgi:hypothetical protein
MSPFEKSIKIAAEKAVDYIYTETVLNTTGLYSPEKRVWLDEVNSVLEQVSKDLINDLLTYKGYREIAIRESNKLLEEACDNFRVPTVYLLGFDPLLGSLYD